MRFGENERERLEAVIASFQHVTVFAGNIIEGAHLLQVNKSYVSKASEMDIAVSRGVADLRARPGVKGKRITELRRCILPEVWASLICLALIQLEKVAVRAGRGYFRSWVGYCAGRK